MDNFTDRINKLKNSEIGLTEFEEDYLYIYKEMCERGTQIKELKEKLSNIKKVVSHCLDNANLMNNCRETCDYYNECNGECGKLWEVTHVEETE